MPALATSFPVGPLLLVYNGVKFNASTSIEAISLRPIKDESGRTVKHTDFSLTASMWLDARGPGARQIEEIMSRLTQPAAGLRIEGRGFGNYQLNFGRLADVRWGPFCTECKIVSRGPNQSVKLMWSVEWSTMTCGDAVTNRGTFPHEFCWRARYEIDKAGYTNRVISGFVSVPATRINAGDRRLPWTVDEMREQISPPLLPGFRRIPGEFEINFAKTRCDFTIRDEEFRGNVPPPNIIDGSLSYTLDQEPGKAYSWWATLSASYELARGANANAAWSSFFGLVEQRRADIKRGAPGRKPMVCIPWKFTLTEVNSYGPPVVQLAAVLKVSAGALPDMLGAAGLWKPLPDSNWGKWSAAIPRHLSPRGTAGLVMRTADDKIVDLCRPEPPVVELRGGRRPGVPVAPPPKKKVVVELGGKDADNPFKAGGGDIFNPNLPALVKGFEAMAAPPPPDQSYLDFQSGYRIESDDGVVVASTLPGSPLVERPQGTGVQDAVRGVLPAGRERSFYPPATDVVSAGSSIAAGGTFTQRRRKPILYVWLFGEAKRLGYPVAIPELIEVAGKPVTACNRTGRGEGFSQGVAGSDAFGNALHVATWNLRYVVEVPPDKPMPTLPNPLVTPAVT